MPISDATTLGAGFPAARKWQTAADTEADICRAVAGGLRDEALGYDYVALLLVALATPLLGVGSVLMTIDPLSVLFWIAALLAGWQAIAGRFGMVHDLVGAAAIGAPRKVDRLGAERREHWSRVRGMYDDSTKAPTGRHHVYRHCRIYCPYG